MREKRILLTDDDFASLCQTGKVKYNNTEVPITDSNFDTLIEGGIAETTHEGQLYKIALQDIGYDRIAMHLSKSKIY